MGHMMSDKNSDIRTAIVTRTTREGVHVRLEDDAVHFIPYHEYGYTESARRRVAAGLKTGNTIEVSVCASSTGPRVSIRRKDFDFWGNVDQEEPFLKDKPLTIKVNSVTPKLAYGAVVWEHNNHGQIELEAFFRFSQLDRYIATRQAQGAWTRFAIIQVGDILKGKVKNIDVENEILELDIVGYIQEIDSDPESSCNHQGSELYVPTVAAEEMICGPVQDVGSIAVIEDDPSFCGLIVNRLKDDGYRAASYPVDDTLEQRLTPDEAKAPFDVYLIDVNLSASGNDRRGIEVAKIIRDRYPYAKIILMTGDTTSLYSTIPESRELLIDHFVTKPFTIKDLPRILTRAVHAKPRRPLKTFMETATEPATKSVPGKSRGPVAGDGISDPLRKLANSCPGSTACLFSLHLTTGACELEKIEGGTLKPDKKYISMLKYSPVRDCIQDKKFVATHDTSESGEQARHKWLSRFFPSGTVYSTEPKLSYGSCMGTRLKYEAQGVGYALFWFHPEKEKIKPEAREILKLTAVEIEKQFLLIPLREALVKERMLSNAARTFRMLGHDLSHNLSTCQLGLDECKKLLLNPSGDRTADCVAKIDELISRLGLCINVTKTYKDFASGHQAGLQETSLQECVEKAWNSVGKTEPGAAVQLMQKTDSRKYWIEAEPISLQQVFFNILGNALQQMRLFGRLRGYIHVSYEGFEINKKPWARILVTDSGPGIHAINFETVFNEGFSTKSDGTGLGLDMVKNTLKGLGGSIRVKSSILFVSTCFEIELPLMRIDR